MHGLREQTRGRVLDVFKSLRLGSPGGVLLCDKLALRAVSSVLRVSEITEEGITLVEALEASRQPLRDFPAVYLITPTVESVNAMIADFADPRRPMYGDVHILFTSHLPDALLAKIKAAAVVSRVKTFQELNFEYIATESQAFTLEAPDALASIYSPGTTTAVQAQHMLADKLVTLFAMYGQMPYIRYAASGHPCGLTLGQLVQSKLERLGSATNVFAKGRASDRPTLLIVDRTLDPLAPVLHEYSYQAMIQDLLPIVDGERYSYRYTTNRGEELKKEVLLNETDPLWPTLRHLHIADCIEYLTSNFNRFLQANQSAIKLNKGKEGVGLKEMSDALRGMPQYQEEMQRYSLHISVTRELMARFKQYRLEAISTLEQNMAMGEDSDGREVKGPALVEELHTMLRGDISPMDKIRLLMAYIITQEGIRDDDRKRLIEAAALSPDDQTALVNLKFLGVTLMRGAGKPSARRKQQPKEKGAEGAGYDLSRYSPRIKGVIEAVLTGAASLSDLPYVKDRPNTGMLGSVPGGDTSAQRGAGLPEPSWASRGRQKKEENVMLGPRLVVFMIGGAAYSELKCAYELTKAHQREVILGSTSMLTPYQFVSQLKALKKLDVFGE